MAKKVVDDDAAVKASAERIAQAFGVGKPQTLNDVQKMLNALKVIALDTRIREWLTTNDPMALAQVEEAITGVEPDALRVLADQQATGGERGYVVRHENGESFLGSYNGAHANLTFVPWVYAKVWAIRAEAERVAGTRTGSMVRPVYGTGQFGALELSEADQRLALKR